jgi:RHS repeat-associated protein
VYATHPKSGTGLNYAMNRWYSSQVGRFTTPDPYMAHAGLANPQSWNRYAYVQNDPVNHNDPTGLLACIVESIGESDWVSIRACWGRRDSVGDHQHGSIPKGGSGAGVPPNKGGYNTDPSETGKTAWQYLTSIWGTCLDFFKRDSRFDASQFESLLNNGMMWLDARSPQIATRTVASYAGNSDMRKIGDLFKFGASAFTLPGTNYIAIGPNYFTDNTQTQQVASAIHEGLHIATGSWLGWEDPDADLASWLMNFGFSPSPTFSSYEITAWIVGTKDLMSIVGGGCKHP